VKRLGNLLTTLLVWVIRAYQTLVSPALRPRCKYYPSCSQYAVDALREYGFMRGVILAGWRLLRCNPLSRGGYDPVERQTLFRTRRGGDPAGGRRGAVKGSSRTRTTPALIIVLLAALLLLMPLSAVSCSFFGTTTSTTTPVTTGAAGVTTTVGSAAGGETATTAAAPEGEQPGSFDRISKPLQALFFWVLEFLHERVHVSWSWAIVLLTVVVRIILVPLTWRQIKSMRAMQALQPQLKALQEKYKNDRQVLNQKVMEFYQQNNVSPFGSCLPLLLQLPVFLGLFYMLRTAGRPGLDPGEWGRWAGVFVEPQVGWLWIADITAFDIGLMFLYIASQFFASWQTARKTGGQQKVIAYVMPLVVGIFMYIYKWPAGLMIYWFTSNLWTIAQQFVAEKLLPIHVPVAATQEKAKAAPAQATAATRAKTTKKAPVPAGKTPAKTTKKGPAPAGKTPAKTGGATPPASAGKSGGVTSGQKTGQKTKTTGGKGQWPDGRAGGSTSSGGT